MTRRARNQVIIKDGIELTYLPPVRKAPRRNAQNVPIIVANPFRQFGGQPAKYRMRVSVPVRGPCATRLVLGVSDQLLTSMAGGNGNLNGWLLWDASGGLP